MMSVNQSEGDKYIIKYLAGQGCIKNTISSRNFSYICNSDNSVRWIFPKELQSPTFLNFFSVGSIKSHTIALVIKFAFLIRFPKLVSSGEIKIEIQKGSILDSVLSKYKHDSFSIFTGTVGENRKAIIELHRNNKTFVLFYFEFFFFYSVIF